MSANQAPRTRLHLTSVHHTLDAMAMEDDEAIDQHAAEHARPGRWTHAADDLAYGAVIVGRD